MAIVKKFILDGIATVLVTDPYPGEAYAAALRWLNPIGSGTLFVAGTKSTVPEATQRLYQRFCPQCYSKFRLAK